MTISMIKALLDACYQAKRARELLPALPKGVTSSYIQYLDTIETLERQGVRVKVSDISDARRYFRRGRGMHHSHHSGALRRHGRKEGHPCLLSAAILRRAAF